MSNKYFDIHSITETPKAQVEGVFSKYLNKHLQRIENVSELCRIPDNGEVFFLQTEKQLLDLIFYILHYGFLS